MDLLNFNEFWLILFLGVSGYLLYTRRSRESHKK
ncbi:hypothetical protein DESME_00980 [Desulfitobacterium metallireducens DSM 15288]|uniref:Uncharacterized protein n=1 Tax=Desulfitobacterium metallireducens DSM 15288 TaxID=871968 RepID=W0EC79_9FIRM|nr:hypothetical protein DESME_00980 [Desulfitobacterium metallireducens DSM 15288]